MKKLSFLEIIIASPKERTAFQTKFDKSLTIITGANSTGKSFLIKSIYSALGAFPVRLPREWKTIRLYILLKFTLDNKYYSVLHRNNEHIFFDQYDNIIGRFQSKSMELNDFVSTLFNCKIKIHNGDHLESIGAYFFFSPFYIDQDEGWISPWGSLSPGGRLPIRSSDAVKYYTGLLTENYCNLLAAKQQISGKAKDGQTILAALTSAFATIESHLPNSLSLLDTDTLNKELEKNFRACNLLSKTKQKISNKINRTTNRLAELEEQKNISKKAIFEITSDYRYFQTKTPHENITCPTCGAIYEKNIIERFNLIRDEYNCKDVLDEIDSVSSRLKKVLIKMKNALRTTNDNLQEKLNLKTTFEKLTDINELIDTHSANKLFNVAAEVLHAKTNELNEVNNSLSEIEYQLSQEVNKEKSTSITTQYRSLMQKHYQVLGIHDIPNIDIPNITGTIFSTGSSVPRIVLAYRYAILRLILQAEQIPISPIIIDAPKQQDVNAANLTKMFELIFEHASNDFQTIISTEELHGMKPNARFIELTSEKGLLREEYFYHTWAAIRHYSDQASYQDLLLF